jgi:hypothetical protein
MARMVQCVKIGRELPGLENPPFPGELGQRIYDNVSAEAYALWQPHMTILINHYGGVLLRRRGPPARGLDSARCRPGQGRAAEEVGESRRPNGQTARRV